jgi:hypothetical protein
MPEGRMTDSHPPFFALNSHSITRKNQVTSQTQAKG